MASSSSHAALSVFINGGRFHQFTYTWSIENLAFWTKKADEYLETDIFRPRLIDDGFWRLRLYPRGRDETLLWYLERMYGERAETVQIHFKITIHCGNVVHYEYHSNNYPFKKGSGAASATEKKLKDIIGEGSLLQDPEPLTVVCQMARKSSAVALSEKLSSFTRIEIGRLTFSWHFGQFSKWNPEEQYTYAGYTYGNAVHDILSCKMHLYTNRDPRDERIGIIIRFRRPPADDFLVVAKISVLDASGKSVISFDETYFEKAGDDTVVWVTPAFIEKKMLTRDAGVYLPKDELTLLSEFKIPVKNIYAARLQYSLASCGALQNLEDTSATVDGVSSSVSTQTTQESERIENGTQTEYVTKKVEHLILEALKQYPAQTLKIVRNADCCDEEDIQLNMDSDEIYEYGSSMEDCISYSENIPSGLGPLLVDENNEDFDDENETIIEDVRDFCLSISKFGLMEENNEEYYEEYFATMEDVRSFCESVSEFGPILVDGNNEDLAKEYGPTIQDSRSYYENVPSELGPILADEDETQGIEVSSYQKDTTKKNIKFVGQENFTKEQSATTEDIYEEDPTSVEDENSDESEDTSGSGNSGDSEDDFTSKDDSDASTSTEDSESSGDATTSEDSEYSATSKRGAKSRRGIETLEESAAINAEEFSEDEGILTEGLDQLDLSCSVPLKCFVIVYFFAMSLYFLSNDAITYSPKQTQSFFYPDGANLEVIKHLTFLYAEALDDPDTLKLMHAYSSSREHSTSRHVTDLSFPNSGVSSKNAWVLLALADSYQDSELLRTALGFLEANKDTTVNSPSWLNEKEATMKKAHTVFRQRFGKKGKKEESEVSMGT